MTASAPFDAVELLGERLLALGCLAREVPAADFLARTVGLMSEALGIRSAWWGLASERDEGGAVELYQADAIGLPDAVAADWRRIAEVDPFARRTFAQRGQVQCLDVEELRGAVLPQLIAFADRYGFATSWR